MLSIKSGVQLENNKQRCCRKNIQRCATHLYLKLLKLVRKIKDDQINET
jgi:transposase-like protein